MGDVNNGCNVYEKYNWIYIPEDSERIVYVKLKNQLPASFEVFYSVGLGAYKESQHKALLEIIRKKFAIMEEIRDRSQLIHLSELLFKQFLIDDHQTVIR